ncbi:hypothetical protein [Marinilabilia rubra]|uniref:Thioredoxin domain-containing protein n=1 Tax=Marinilabilia rubra TaxID=2162893 RepID=A0A2U2B7H9_9BACT|nr:hypothetical protein [Marinilabilia rubra]PWD99017.1 hypothetical protein DDZ16_12185 [Marinilabilia rubra]
MKNFLFLVGTVFLLFSCNNLPPKEKELRKILNKSLNLDNFETVQQGNTLWSLDELKQNHGYLSVVYLQNSCNPCYPKFIEWQQKMDSINTPNSYTVLFVIKGNSYGEFMTNVLDIEYVEDKYYTIMDPEGKFLANNSDIPRWIIDNSILIDSENKIKMVGAPFATPEMTELFYEVCQKPLK